MFSRIVITLKSQRAFLIGLVLILCFATFTRFYRLSIPSEYFFDEVYHAVTSKLIARDDPRAYEWWNPPVEPNTAVDWLHPPIAKYTQALSMKAFGENSFGWRFSSAVFGVLVVAATALLAHVYFKRRSITLLAAFLVSLDGLLLAQSRIAMNDIHVTFFIVMATAIYGIYRNQLEEKRPANIWLLLTGVTAGLAMGTKWSGVYILAAIWLAEFFRIPNRLLPKSQRLIQGLRTLVFLGLVPAIMYLASYSHMFLQGKTLVCTGNTVKNGECYCSQESSAWVSVLSKISPKNKLKFEALEARGGCKRLISHFSELHHQILWYQTHLTATHTYQSRPWQWALDVRPVWQYVNYSQSNTGVIAHIYNAGNPILFWFGLSSVLISLVLFSLHKFKPLIQRKSKLDPSNWRIALLLVSYFIIWVPWSFSPRIMFFYHYAPAIPIMSVLTAYVVVRFWKRAAYLRGVFIAAVALIFLAFVFFYPLNTGLPMQQGYFDTIFNLFPTWR